MKISVARDNGNTQNSNQTSIENLHIIEKRESDKQHLDTTSNHNQFIVIIVIRKGNNNSNQYDRTRI